VAVTVWLSHALSVRLRLLVVVRVVLVATVWDNVRDVVTVIERLGVVEYVVDDDALT